MKKNTKKNLQVITFGGLTQDIMFYTKDAVLIKNKNDLLRQELIGFEYGAKIRSDKVNFVFGGGGGNTAVSFAKLGLTTACLGWIGHDRAGDDYLENFRINKVSSSLIERDEQYHSGFSFIINYGDYNEHVIFSYRGANDRLKINVKKLQNQKSDWFYIAALSGGKIIENLKLIFAVARNNRVKIAWNPGKEELKKGAKNLKRFFQQTEVLVVNYDEAIELAISINKKEKNIKNLAKVLYSLGPKLIAISQGHNGAYLYDGQKIYFERALPIIGINTTGAGDAFGSSLVAGIILFRKNYQQALRLAIIRSNYVIQKIGAQTNLLNKTESLKLMNKYYASAH